MRCSSSEAHFEALLDGTLAPRRRALVLAHLRGCGRCTGIFAELRALDALLAGPRVPELPGDFSFATMAEVRALPPPRRRRSTVGAFVVSFLVGSWLLIAAVALLDGPALRAATVALLDIVGGGAWTTAALLHGGMRVFRDLGAGGTLLGAAALADLAVLLALAAVLLRPTVSQRRS